MPTATTRLRYAFTTLAALTVALLASPIALRAQQPPDDEVHAKIRKEIADAEKKPDARKSKVPGEEAKDRADAHQKPGKNRDADDAKKPTDEKKSTDKKADDKSEVAKPVVTHGDVTIDGKKIRYTATAGKMVMKTDEGDPKAEVFFIAYTYRDREKPHSGKKESESGSRAERAAKRPITFAFNGGPGSSSVWLHLGMLGPQRVKLDSNAGTLPPPHELLPNEYSLLDKTDLVFIDPVSTGFSRPVKGEDKKQFHGYDEDLRSVGQFIHDYTTKYNRWKSPKFLIGESYGGLRAAGLAGELQDRYHLYLNGVIMVSAVVDFQTLMASGNNDIAYALFLPTYATTAWYHKQLSDDLQKKSVQEINDVAEKFALGPYLRALAAGDSLGQQQREEMVARMAELTGLSQDYVEAADLRVPMFRFGQELLRKQGKVIGRFDSRYAGPALDRIGSETDYDPSASAVFGVFTSALNDYVRTTLKVKEERVYEILTDRVHPWDYSEFSNRFVNASPSLRNAMVQNPYLRVFAACGYYDLATPPFAMEHTRNHLDLPKNLRDNFRTEFYEGGHMMYAHEPSLAKLRKDLVEFYADALKPLQEK